MKKRRKRMNLTENKKVYLVSRVNKDGEESLAYLDPYSGNLSFFNNLETASRLETYDEAKEIVKAQETLAKILKRDDKFIILEEATTISEVEIEKTKEKN